jgi:hypothetical protein
MPTNIPNNISTKNACDTAVDTLDCNPQNRNLWFKYDLPKDVDPIRSNIVNGCWECNYAESNDVNTTLCNRAMYDEFIPNPCNIVKDTDINSRLKNLGIPLGRHCKKD